MKVIPRRWLQDRGINLKSSRTTHSLYHIDKVMQHFQVVRLYDWETCSLPPHHGGVGEAMARFGVGDFVVSAILPTLL